jgi:hypothetical protein
VCWLLCLDSGLLRLWIRVISWASVWSLIELETVLHLYGV